MSVSDRSGINAFRIVNDVAAFSGYIVLAFDAEVKKIGDLETVIHQLQEISGLLGILAGGGDAPCRIHGRGGIKEVRAVADRDGSELLAGLCGPVGHVAACGASSEEAEDLALCHGIKYCIAVADGVRKSVAFLKPVTMHHASLFVIFGRIPVLDLCAIFHVHDDAVCDVSGIAERVEDIAVRHLCSNTITHGNCILRHTTLFDLAEEFVIILCSGKDLRNLNIVFFCQRRVIKEQSAAGRVQGSRISVDLAADLTGMDHLTCFCDHILRQVISHRLDQALACQDAGSGQKAGLYQVDLLIGSGHQGKLLHHLADGDGYEVDAYADFRNTDLIDSIFDFLKIYVIKPVGDDLHVHIIDIFFCHRDAASGQKREAHDPCQKSCKYTFLHSFFLAFLISCDCILSYLVT